MIISDQQVRLALEYLHTAEAPGAVAVIDPAVGVTSELVERVKTRLAGMPETRLDRVEEARELLLGAEPSSQDVAAKMIGRIISDSIR
ncbi:MAG: hypothetical protein Q7W30_04350 [Coriobacteriia bacterium]|nr:hypothetical protein [Coriobacteriia bacterium]